LTTPSGHVKFGTVILENLELDERDVAQVELEQLADGLRDSGFSVEVAPVDGSFHAQLQESAEQVALDVLNVVLEEGEAHVVDALIGYLVGTWAKNRKHFRDRDDGEATAVIWGPDGKPIREVRLPAPDEKAD
jgi:hypothetical protein